MSASNQIIRTSFDDLLSPEPKSSATGGGFEFPEFGERSKWKERNDRQLRLWGIHGQDLIDKARVCLLNATSVGAETLKNIVLPGFGQFTIVDAKKVEPRDLGINFYITVDMLGKSRALSVCQNIAELNEENVTGEYYEKDPVEVIEKEPNFFDKFEFIIASQMDHKSVAKLAKICEAKNKTLVVVRSYGLVGYLRLYAKTQEIFDSKPDQAVNDLRLTQPWPELLKFCDLQDLEKMNNVEYIHTPYPVILLKLMQQWRKEHGGHLPKTEAEKQSYMDLLEKFRKLEKRTPQQIEDDEKAGIPAPTKDNFKDAKNNAYMAYIDPEIPDRVKAVLADPQLDNLTKDTSDFWFLAYGLKKFLQNEGKGLLPLQGRLPDLESDTTRYTKMQAIYRRKAKADREFVSKYVKEALKKVGRDENGIKDEDLVDFCSNSYYIGAIHYRTIEEEFSNPNTSAFQEALMEDPASPANFYFALRAVDKFHDQYGRYPGENLNDDASQEAELLKPIFEKVIAECGLTEVPFDVSAYCKEVARYGASELHNISSLVGGVAAQELIKLCTKQRIPVQNTWIFNGVTGATTVVLA